MMYGERVSELCNNPRSESLEKLCNMKLVTGGECQQVIQNDDVVVGGVVVGE